MTLEENANMMDQKYATDLAIKHSEGQWQTFYRAIAALEHGCGHLDMSPLSAICKQCAEEDAYRLLQVIEKKEQIYDMVAMLLCVDHNVKMEWLRTNAFSTIPGLFECLRQVLVQGKLIEEDHFPIAHGLCNLLEQSLERFQYLFNSQLDFKAAYTGVLSTMLSQLSEKGWQEYCKYISFQQTGISHFDFWMQWGQFQKWDKLYQKAYPLVKAWNEYIHKFVAQQAENCYFGDSLYNVYSNGLIQILCYQLDSVTEYTDAISQAVDICELAMQRWYNSSSCMCQTFLACLSQIALLHYVWLNKQREYAAPFPEKTRLRLLHLMIQCKRQS